MADLAWQIPALVLAALLALIAVSAAAGYVLMVLEALTGFGAGSMGEERLQHKGGGLLFFLVGVWLVWIAWGVGLWLGWLQGKVLLYGWVALTVAILPLSRWILRRLQSLCQRLLQERELIDNSRLTALERMILEALRRDTSLGHAVPVEKFNPVVRDRSPSGVGFLTEFDQSDDLKWFVDGTSLRWEKIGARVNGTHTGYLVYVDNGYVTAIEGYTYGEDWPSQTDRVELYEIKPGMDLT